MSVPLVPPPPRPRGPGAAPCRPVALGLALAATLVQGCGLYRTLTTPAPVRASVAATPGPAGGYTTTQEGSLTVRSGLPPRAGDVPEGAAMPPVPPRPPLQAETETTTTTTSTTTTTAEAQTPPPAPEAPAETPAETLPETPALAADAGPAPETTTTTTTVAEGPFAPDAGAGGLVAGRVRAQSATGAFTGGRGGCEALAATTLERENRLGDATPPAELLALGTMHLELARCARGAGDAALARARARQAAVLLARADAGEIDAGNLSGLADTRSQLGHAAYEAGEYPEARRLLRDAVARYSALGRGADAKRDLRLLAVLGAGPAPGP